MNFPGARFPALSLAAVSIMAAIVLGAEGWLLFKSHGNARDTERALQRLRTERRQLSQVRPAPTPENEAAIEAELRHAERTRAAMLTRLRGAAVQRLQAQPEPATRAEAYFDLATFTERMNETAKRRGVAIHADARHFGFASYRHAGPDDPHRAAIFLQRQVVEHLLEALFEAGPSVLLSIKRESPGADGATAAGETPTAARGASARANLVGAGGDFFLLDPRRSVRVPGSVGTWAFQLKFAGETQTLRALLNRLATHEFPVVVREVEVEPARIRATRREDSSRAVRMPVAPSFVLTTDRSEVSQTIAGGAEETVIPLVVDSVSDFTVTVEYVTVFTATAAAGAPEDNSTKSPI